MYLGKDFITQLAFGDAEQIQAIRLMELRYKRQYLAVPVDLSHWNAGPEYSRRVLESMILPHSFSTLDYLYGDERSERYRVLESLGFAKRKHGIALAPSATAAAVLCGAFLKRVRIDRVHIVCPAYFTSFRLFELLGIECNSIEGHFSRGKWSLPAHISRHAGKSAAVWITDPVFSVGQRWNKADVFQLKRLAGTGTWVIIDQALGKAAGGLHQLLAGCERVIGIHSPHKALCINSFKFAAIVHRLPLESFFTECSDIAYGGLSMANMCAIQHYLSANFDTVTSVAKETVAGVWNFLTRAAKDHPHASFSLPESGFFSLCVVRDLPADFAESPNDFWKLIRESGVSILPGSRSHMPVDIGFTFRLNLMRDSSSFRAGLIRLLQFLGRAINARR